MTLFVSAAEQIIIYQDENLLVVNKPANQSFHSESGEAGFFQQWQEQIQTVLWPVHRLDKVTSGLLVMAKNKATTQQLQQLFEQHQVSKCYIALSDRKPQKKQGWVKGDMSASRNGSYRLLRSMQNPAITRFDSQTLRPGLRLFRLFPQTGKTHQLRVMMKSIGSPIMGDERYKGSTADRCYLHAMQISFELNGKHWQFFAPPVSGALFTEMPADFFIQIAESD